MEYKTEQENFWAGDFGNAYIERNQGDALFFQKTATWAKILKCVNNVNSAVELGCNIGLNLQAFNAMKPNLSLTGYEINEKAAELARGACNATIKHDTIIDKIDDGPFDIAFTSGVLIHINPEHLNAVYENLYMLSRRYVIVAEYYNPTPVSVTYRGHNERLFKRDFAGDLMDTYDMKLVDYGFIYKRDNWAPRDDFTYFVLEK